MSQEVALFALLSLITLVSGYWVVRCRNLVHAAFWLMPTFFGVALLFLLLGNELLFTVQLLIYSGAIPITVLFVLMLTREVMRPDRTEFNRLGAFGAAAAVLFLGLCLAGARTAGNPVPPPSVPVGLTRRVGEAFLTDYLLPFEVASLMLLGALVGAVYLARSDKKARSEVVGLERKKLIDQAREEEKSADAAAAGMARRRGDSV